MCQHYRMLTAFCSMAPVNLFQYGSSVYSQSLGHRRNSGYPWPSYHIKTYPRISELVARARLPYPGSYPRSSELCHYSPTVSAISLATLTVVRLTSCILGPGGRRHSLTESLYT